MEIIILYHHDCIIKLPGRQLNGNLTLIFMIRCKYFKKKKKKKKKNQHLRKYLSWHSTLRGHIHRIYRVELNLHISPSVISRGSCKFCRQYHHPLLHHYSYHLIIRPFCCIAAMELAAAAPPPIVIIIIITIIITFKL